LPILFVILIFAIFATAAQAQPQVLQGGVQHKEYLPQMPTQMQPGNPYLQAEVQGTSIVWYPLPQWLTGTFESDFITNQVIQVYSPMAPRHASSGRLQHIENFGVQLDSSGRAWQADFLPHVSTWEGAQREQQRTIEKECLVSNDQKIVLHIHNLCLYIDRKTQLIAYAEQVDGYKTITLRNGNGDLDIYDDIQEYDGNGAPLERYIATSTMRRVENFAPVDFINGINLSASLAQYLASIGRSDLIPSQSTNKLQN
jgi:hypothetical protein